MSQDREPYVPGLDPPELPPWAPLPIKRVDVDGPPPSRTPRVLHLVEQPPPGRRERVGTDQEDAFGWVLSLIRGVAQCVRYGGGETQGLTNLPACGEPWYMLEQGDVVNALNPLGQIETATLEWNETGEMRLNFKFYASIKCYEQQRQEALPRVLGLVRGAGSFRDCRLDPAKPLTRGQLTDRLAREALEQSLEKPTSLPPVPFNTGDFRK